MKDSIENQRNTCFCLEFDSMAYLQAWDLQQTLAALRKEQRICSDVFMILEHPPVFTLGRRGMQKNLKVPETLLKKANIALIRVERGGDITYHGPGQLIGYPVFNLHHARLSVVEYVRCLEEIMLRTVADWGITAERNSLNRGIWVGNHKLGSVGVAVRRGISFHGFALNVNTNLGPFEWINPCGLEGIGVTSMAGQLSRKVSIRKVRTAVKRHLEAVFKVKLVETDLNMLMRCET
jgi:lipoate-protein ligase B